MACGDQTLRPLARGPRGAAARRIREGRMPAERTSYTCQETLPETPVDGAIRRAAPHRHEHYR